MSEARLGSPGTSTIPGGVNIKRDSFMTVMRRAQSRGYVKDHHAAFVEEGLRHGFTVGFNRDKFKGKRVFSNYPTAEAARSQVTAAIQARVVKGRTVQLGPWNQVRSQLDALTDKYAVFPIGAVDKASDPSVKRPTDDHTRTACRRAESRQRQWR